MDWISLLSLKRYGDREKRHRWLQDELRLGFEVDYDRIIFSNDFRSLQDKTQVLPLSEKDFVHTRLTHSLEVSVVGRTLGRLAGQLVLDAEPELKKDGYRAHDFGAIVAAACLAHDIGNPPFGHGGERAIGEYFSRGGGKSFKPHLNAGQWADLTRFEGNANGFHLLVNDRNGNPGGIRLSYATLGAFMKYPKPSVPDLKNKHIATKKYGVFTGDIAFLEELTEELGMHEIQTGTGAYVRHPLAYLVEAADDICYSVIDFEDAINLGYVPEEKALEYLLQPVRKSIQSDKYNAMKTRKERLAYLRALTINTLIYDTIAVFDKNRKDILKGTFSHALVSKSQYKAQLDDILDITRDLFYKSDEVVEKEMKGYRVIQYLLDVFIHAVENIARGVPSAYDRLVFQMLPETYRDLPEKDLYSRLMGVVGYIASLSDKYCLSLYDKLT